MQATFFLYTIVHWLLFFGCEVIVAENGRLKNIDTIAKRFRELAMAYKGEVKATVTTVVVSSVIPFRVLLHTKIVAYWISNSEQELVY